MRKALIILAPFLLVPALFPASGQTAGDLASEKYARLLAKIYELKARFSPIHPALAKAYLVAVVEDKIFFVFEPGEGAYRLALTTPDTFGISPGTRAAMPLGFWNGRVACVVTPEVFDQPDGYVFIFHEFVHCAQWESCELKLKEGLSIYHQAMESKDYMWELQYPFPYTKPAFVNLYQELLTAWAKNDGTSVGRLRRELRNSLSSGEWEYLSWQEWKEGLARYLENRMRAVLGLAENKGGESPPFSRVTFYRGGDQFIRFLETGHPGSAADMEALYHAMAEAERLH
jgi:hypothetical protein